MSKKSEDFLSGDIMAGYRRRAVRRPMTVALAKKKMSKEEAMFDKHQTPVIKCSAKKRDLRKLRTPILQCPISPVVPCPD